MTQKQLINANNAELNNVKAEVAKLPMADDVKNGRYVWGKYDAKGGTLLSFTISDSETAYPDGGEKDGFWWEMVKESGTKMEYGTVSLSSTQNSITINHSLGVVPTKAVLFIDDSSESWSYAFDTIFTSKFERKTYRRNLWQGSQTSKATSNSVTFTVYADMYPFTNTRPYHWVVIA